MTRIVCNKCGKTEFISNHIGDYVHECHTGDPTLDYEDILVIGNWSDPSASGTSISGIVPIQVTAQAGLVNELQGTIAGNKGEDFNDVTDRGNKKPLYRQRKSSIYIENTDGTREL